MTHALDCSKASDTVARRVRPHRHRSGTPKAVCTLDPACIGLAAAEIVDRVRANQRGGRGSSYLYIDHDMSVYVIHEQHAAAREWATDLKGRWHTFVGVYQASRDRGEGLSVSLQGVFEDIREHLIDLRRTA